ncbi:protein PROTON GRADIENT REGULATION 5, chloroplastic-like [Iris pallida]|uniref:Protein PROTON GRADIENT REGULATION 5, chloroplastic-like n=1 Tax=Iris pallida TaxID=29817 RepID=A0AAX6FYS6_IRIPA|nr:protein PROTON GRADIENT REGULATION 5, chloroplastic-like [Iris pallida]
MAISISAAGGLSSAFHGSWATQFAGEDREAFSKAVNVASVRVGGKPSSIRPRPMMGNVNEGKGLFAPLVVVARNVVGKKRFNQLRGKAIALHSQVITEFCKAVGADGKQRQGLIRLAKLNGERLGFLA